MLSLKEKSFQGIIWSFIDNISGSGISFIIGIILARLLTPATFGIIGMVTVFFAIANTCIDSGFSTGLVRKVNCTQLDFDTVFYFNIAVSTILYLLFFFTAPYIAKFYGEPQISILIRILASVIVIDSISIVQRVIFTRAINFKVQTKISLISAVTSGIVGIIMAYNGFGVWSLVMQIFTKQILLGVLFWSFSNWRPTLQFSKTVFVEMFRFGSRLLGSGMITSVQNNIYYFVIGKYFSAAGLGYYTRADQFNSIVTNNITGTIERVFLPVLSSIQNEESRMKATLVKMLRTSFFITFFSLMVLAVLAKPMIFLLIGSKWAQSVVYLQLICISSIFFPFSIVNLNILKVRGRSDLILRLQLIKTGLTAVIILSGVFWGITVMLIVRIFTTLIATFINSQYSGKLMNYPVLQQAKDIAPYFFSIGTIILVMAVVSFFPIDNLYMIAFMQVAVAFSLFLLIFEKKQHAEYVEIKSLVTKRLTNVFSKRFIKTVKVTKD